MAAKANWVVLLLRGPPLGQSEKLQGREREQRGVAAPEAGRLLRAMMSQDPF